MNELTGTISPKIGNMKKLKEVVFWRTQIAGWIPKEIGEITKIKNLEMYGNQFTGNISLSLGNCTSSLKRIGTFHLMECWMYMHAIVYSTVTVTCHP
jgi:hypothetical protein